MAAPCPCLRMYLSRIVEKRRCQDVRVRDGSGDERGEDPGAICRGARSRGSSVRKVPDLDIVIQTAGKTC